MWYIQCGSTINIDEYFHITFESLIAKVHNDINQHNLIISTILALTIGNQIEFINQEATVFSLRKSKCEVPRNKHFQWVAICIRNGK